MRSLRIIFAGTPDFAAKHLASLLTSSHQIVGVFTQPDRPAGRGNKLLPSAVKQLAQQHDLPLFQPERLRLPEQQQLIANLNADLMVVVAYGLILPKAVLAMPRLGCINVHGSLLPRWRGAAPIQRAVWAGDQETGVTIMQMDEGLDTGPMLYKACCAIDAQETSATLYEKLADIGPNALLTTLDHITTGCVTPEIQCDDLANYAEKLTKDEARLNWHLSAEQLERCVRAFNPWPVSYFTIDNQSIKVWQAEVVHNTHNAQPGTILSANKQGIVIATGEGSLRITSLQPAGKKVMSAQDLLNSRKAWFTVGSQLN